MTNSKQKIVNAQSLLENIRVVRGVIRAGKFDDAMFDSINGEDRALESLVQRDVVFGLLDEAGRTSLRREIMNRLAENEITTLGKLRDYLTDVFAPLQGVVDKGQVASEGQAEAIENAKNISDLYREHLPTATLDSSTFTKDGIKECVEALEKCTEFIDRVSPVLTRVMADADEENNDDNGLPTVDTTNGSEQAPAEEPQPEPPMNDPDHQVFVNPAEDDEPALQAMTQHASNNKSMAACLDKFILADEKCQNSMNELGFTKVEDIVDAVKAITASDEAFVDACVKLLDTFPVRTTTSENLLKATKSRVDAYDALNALVNTANAVRSRLHETRDGLVLALKTMEDASRK